MPIPEQPQSTRASFHEIPHTSSSSESTSDDDEFETPFSKMSFEEFERYQKAKTEALEKSYNDVRNAISAILFLGTSSSS